MKTAVSIPNKVYETAEKLAKRSGTSRSKLYTLALENYLAKQNEEEITRKLNEFYDKNPSPHDPVIAKMQYRALAKDKW